VGCSWKYGCISSSMSLFRLPLSVFLVLGMMFTFRVRKKRDGIWRIVGLRV
jgi:hypothetical protein